MSDVLTGRRRGFIILDLPAEITHLIISKLSFEDLADLRSTSTECHRLASPMFWQHFIYSRKETLHSFMIPPSPARLSTILQHSSTPLHQQHISTYKAVHGATLLGIACIDGHFRNILLLLSHGVPLTACFRSWTPLQLLTLLHPRPSDPETAELCMREILRAGADIHACAPVFGATPLALAVYARNVWAVEMLLRAGAQVGGCASGKGPGVVDLVLMLREEGVWEVMRREGVVEGEIDCWAMVVRGGGWSAETRRRVWRNESWCRKWQEDSEGLWLCSEDSVEFRSLSEG